MPSDYAKKKAAKKKEAVKVKGGKKAGNTLESGEATPNGVSGTATPQLVEENGTSTPTEKKTNGVSKATYEEELCKRLDIEAVLAAEARACTGNLGIHPMSRDIKITNLSVTFHGVELLLDTKLELSVGQR